MDFNLAPLNVRRDIDMPGCIHRAAKCTRHRALWRFFRRAGPTIVPSTRSTICHTRKIAEWTRGRDLEIMRRSAFGMIRIYNLLPQVVVDHIDVKSFQNALTQLVRNKLNNGDPTWRFLLSSRHPLFNTHPLRR